MKAFWKLHKEEVRLRRLVVFNSPIGNENYIAHVLKEKAKQVQKATKQYVDDLAEDHPREFWTMLQYSLPNMITY